MKDLLEKYRNASKDHDKLTEILNRYEMNFNTTIEQALKITDEIYTDTAHDVVELIQKELDLRGVFKCKS